MSIPPGGSPVPGREAVAGRVSRPGHGEAAEPHHGFQVHSQDLACPAPRRRQAALAPHVAADANGGKGGQRRGGRPPDLLQGAAPEAGPGRRGLGRAALLGGRQRRQRRRWRGLPPAGGGRPGSAAPPPGRRTRCWPACPAAGSGGSRGVGDQGPAGGVAVDVLAAQDMRGELVLKAAEEAPELRVRAHELRAAGHEQLEGVAQRLGAVGQRQLRPRVYHLLLPRLQLGPCSRPKAAAPGGRGRGCRGPAPPPLHAAPHRRPLAAARVRRVAPPPSSPPAFGSAAAAAAGASPAGASLVTFLAASAAAAPPPPRAEDAGEDPAARYKMAAGAHPWALSLDGASPPWFLFLLLSCLLSPSAFL